MVYPPPGVGLELSPRPLTAVEPEFRDDQLAGQSPVAHGVKCHVSYDMARYGNGVGHRFFQQEENILFRLRAESLRFGLVSVRLREWNCSCSN